MAVRKEKLHDLVQGELLSLKSRMEGLAFLAKSCKPETDHLAREGHYGIGEIALRLAEDTGALCDLVDAAEDMSLATEVAVDSTDPTSRQIDKAIEQVRKMKNQA